MATKSTLNAKNLEPLGTARLAELLIEISTGSAVAKRRLRLELAGAQSPKEAAREVAKRLTSIARAKQPHASQVRMSATGAERHVPSDRLALCLNSLGRSYSNIAIPRILELRCFLKQPTASFSKRTGAVGTVPF